MNNASREGTHYLKTELYERLSAEPEVFEFLERGSLDGVWYWDIENPKEEWYSPAFKRLFGYEEQEIPNTSTWWQENIHLDDLQLALDNFERHCSDPSHAYDQVVRYRHKDGHTVWVRCRGVVFRDADGKPIRMLGAHTDVTALKKAEEGNALLAALVTSSDDAILSVDLSGAVTSWNNGAESVFGYSTAEILGQPVHILSPASKKTEVSAIINRVLAGHKVEHFETVRIHKDGTEIPVSLSISPVKIGGRVVALSAIARDISKQKKQSQELEAAISRLEESTEALEQSNQDLQQFAYVASHDLQTPLRHISGFVQLLRDHYSDKLDSDAIDWIDEAVGGVDRMKELIQALLSYSRAGARAMPMEPVSLNECLERALIVLTPSIEDSDADISHGNLPNVIGDRIQLTQLFQNLLNNAIKYRGANAPTIRVECSPSQDGWTISVVDNGIGIAPEYRERIFQIFERLHSRTKYPGTGIGLAICQRIVRKHGGRLWVESSKNDGSTFKFTLPADGVKQ